jgi:hypothetical protein
MVDGVAPAAPSLVLQAVEEVGATLGAALVVLGDRLGLYRALAGAGPLTPGEVSARAGVSERYVREWLNAQAAAGYVVYDPDSSRYTLPSEHAAAFTDATSPAYLPGLFQLALGAVLDSPRVAEAAQSGAGIAWDEHGHDVIQGDERTFGLRYGATLLSDWLPELDGVVSSLEHGATVAVVGRSRRAAAAIAEAFPRSLIADFDAGQAASYSGEGYDLVTIIDCLHDLGDPVGAARHVRRSLAPEGTWMIVEPFAGDRVEENLTSVGRVYYALSTLLSVPASLSYRSGVALGAQAGEARIREVTERGGFTRFRRIAETPLSLVFEARP